VLGITRSPKSRSKHPTAHAQNPYSQTPFYPPPPPAYSSPYPAPVNLLRSSDSSRYDDQSSSSIESSITMRYKRLYNDFTDLCRACIPMSRVLWCGSAVIAGGLPAHRLVALCIWTSRATRHPLLRDKLVSDIGTQKQPHHDLEVN
jgi:hypothetical protein